MAARNRARTPVRIRCIQKTTSPETSCGTHAEAYKAPHQLTVAIRDLQPRLAPVLVSFRSHHNAIAIEPRLALHHPVEIDEEAFVVANGGIEENVPHVGEDKLRGTGRL
jgi:hypothetical protein